MLEEAKKRDHRKLGKELELYVIDSEFVGQGLPLWLPRGTAIIEELEKLAKETEFAAGYARVRTPHLAKERLYRTSGHLPYYKDSMFAPMEVKGDITNLDEILRLEAEINQLSGRGAMVSEIAQMIRKIGDDLSKADVTEAEKQSLQTARYAFETLGKTLAEKFATPAADAEALSIQIAKTRDAHQHENLSSHPILLSQAMVPASSQAVCGHPRSYRAFAAVAGGAGPLSLRAERRIIWADSGAHDADERCPYLLHARAVRNRVQCRKRDVSQVF
jgi:seryl-tRNA synthetase